MDRSTLVSQIEAKQSFLCVGLDTSIARIPQHLKKSKDPVFEFNKRIIDATHKYCIAYKPNLAFYEEQGSSGWKSLEKTLEYIPDDSFIIADAKRGDIGNTSKKYAKAFFENLRCDAVTVNPYMGKDSIEPFLEFEGKWVVILALTSNPSSEDLELKKLSGGRFVFEHILELSKQWGSPDQVMFVVGATQADKLQRVREIVPDHFLLVPGVGAQGGDLESVARYGMNSQCGIIVNIARSIIYAGQGDDFLVDVAKEAGHFQSRMAMLLDQYLPRNSK